ncbi:MAG: DEAD/DEAH box helicase family protein, partial [Chloroflexota bacterium]|nr:DEAD/DEAH box helicase family protein [Chloroflexota bacterium]
MSETTAHEAIAQALETLEEAKSVPTGGKWLERLTAQMAPYIKEWDISHCWTWAEWPDRESLLPGTSNQDNGIDAVAVDSSGNLIAIQCKSRQLDESGHGEDIARKEINSFIAESENELYTQRWLVTNGDNRHSARAERTNSQLSKKIKLINLHADLSAQAQGSIGDEECPHCQPNPDGEWRRQSKTCMQNDAVTSAATRLRGQLETDLDDTPIGQARGKIILPCGTGKTRVSLRIVEELSPPGGLSVVLCPSIALVAQIRREYLLNSERPIRALAVCSDETAGYNPRKEDQRNTFEEVTADSSNVSANEIKGKVTTDPEEIARWIVEGQENERLSVIFGTYQSGHRIAEALRTLGTTAEVLVCDEAHRTAGLRRTKKSTVDQIRDFTLCHDNDMFPAKHRIYQTATPKIYTQKALREKQKEDWVVRNMDDQRVFGPDLFRRSYRDAVENKWLSDYRIIAVGISGAESHEVANALASATESKGRNPLTSTHFLRGLAFTLAMGGATKGREDEEIDIKSCIAFMNTVDKSDNMVKALDTEPVRNWLRDRMREMDADRAPAAYTLDHLDASSNVTKREEAKARLAEGTLEDPHGVINVGIFGEGTDSPSLSAVAFLEARRSPIDVVQAVGRAMRTSPGKEMGYVICPIVIPLDNDAENFLKNSNPQDGWKELGDILLALRAHDERIEDRLAELMTLYLPPEPEAVKTILGIAHEETKRMSYWEHVGRPGAAELALQEVLDGAKRPGDVFTRVSDPPDPRAIPAAILEAGAEYRTATTDRPIEPSQSLSGKRKESGETEIRKGGVAREKPDEKTGMPGKVDIDRTKREKIKPMAEGKGGTVVTSVRERRPRRTQAEINEQAAMRLMELDANDERSKLITMNLLEKSGLRGHRPERDANMIQDSIYEAAHQLRNDSLKEPLDKHFNLNYLDDKARENQADGCTIAALLMMNAAMLHQRISAGRWLDGVESLDAVKNSNNPVSEIKDQWNTIRARDFRPVIEPALEAIRAVERTGRTGGLVRAVRHIAKEAEELAASYADLGADHAGPLFNRVMGNQASDGAYFTRPVAASIAARLTLDALGELDWTSEDTWKAHKTVDLACGSGTLLTAMLTEMKRRAREQGATASDIGRLQKTAVEDSLKGMDINPISLQLAASQLTTGNQDIGYRRMGLHRMPYGPDAGDPSKVSAGTLELLGQGGIVPRSGELDLPDERIASEEVWTQGGEAMEDAVDAVKGGVRIVIMNPPFTNRSKMGEKFPQETQRSLRKRVDDLERLLV